MFEDCHSLSSVTLPGSVKEVPQEAFYNCPITEVTLGEGIESIGEEAFSWKRNLKNITLPESVKTIGKSAFAESQALQWIAFPKKVEEVEEKAFYNCTAIKTIIINNPMMKLSSSAFSVRAFTASSISEIYFEGTREQWENFEIENEFKLPPTRTDVIVHCTDGEITIQKR